jgi:hypothetical protein
MTILSPGAIREEGSRSCAFQATKTAARPGSQAPRSSRMNPATPHRYRSRLTHFGPDVAQEEFEKGHEQPEFHHAVPGGRRPLRGPRGISHRGGSGGLPGRRCPRRSRERPRVGRGRRWPLGKPGVEGMPLFPRPASLLEGRPAILEQGLQLGHDRLRAADRCGVCFHESCRLDWAKRGPHSNFVHRHRFSSASATWGSRRPVAAIPRLAEGPTEPPRF